LCRSLIEVSCQRSSNDQQVASSVEDDQMSLPQPLLPSYFSDSGYREDAGHRETKDRVAGQHPAGQGRQFITGSLHFPSMCM
jgi:hypothetical protein